MNIGSGELPLFRDANSGEIVYYDPRSEAVEIHKPGAYWVPAVGIKSNPKKWDGHTYISGATGSGKSWLIDQMLNNDELRQDREHIMFTDLKDKDESIKSKYKKFGDKGVDMAYISGHLDGNVFIFDDCTSPDVLQFRNHLLEKGRHRKSTVIAVNHRLRDGMKTKQLMNESRYVVTFPSTNRGAVASYMKQYMEMEPPSVRIALKKSISEGRHLIFHCHHPNAVASTETCWLI